MHYLPATESSSKNIINETAKQTTCIYEKSMHRFSMQSHNVYQSYMAPSKYIKQFKGQMNAIITS
jgi:hypothetical protein